MKKTCTYKSAFTLIEVLIALFILAIAMLACFLTTRRVTQSAIHVDNAITAHWVGMNVLAQMQMDLLPVPKDQSESGTAEMLNRQWQWQAAILGASDNASQIKISVSYQHKQYAVLDGAIEK